MSIRVLIADDQPLMRAALRMCLTAEPDIDVVAEASDGVKAIELVHALKPNVAMLDIRMPNMDGVEATARLTSEGSSTRVLVLTTFHLDEYVLAALRAGASAFLLKDATPEEIVRAVRVVAAGNALLAPAVTKRLLDQYMRQLSVMSSPDSERLQELTAREIDVLTLIAQGCSNGEIGRELHIAESSVKTHVGHLLTKLGLPARVHLVIFAYESGLVRSGQS